jgi:hypothetical protein
MIEMAKSLPGLSIAVVSSLSLAAGYFYRAHRENKKNRRLALYSLLEIWYRLSIFYVADFGDAIDRIMSAIWKHYPQEEISNESSDATKAALSPIVLQVSREAALSDLDGYLDSYEEAIRLVSGDDPILAYKISSAGGTKKLLGLLDDYFGRVLPGIEMADTEQTLFATMRESVTEHMLNDSLEGLESHIRRLSLSISVRTFWASSRVMGKRKKLLNHIDETLVEDLVAGVLIPAFRKLNRSATNDD